MTRFLRGPRPPRPSATRGHPLAGLRPAPPAPEWQPPWRRGPVDPAYDPCGAPPIQVGGLPEHTRAAAIAAAVILIAGGTP